MYDNEVSYEERIKKRKRALIGKITSVIVVIGVLVGLKLCIEKVPAGYVGVQYSMSGGVQDELLTQGWHLVSPNKKVYLYSIKTEQMYMSADSKDGSKEDNSFDVMAKDGKLNIDFEMAYSFDSENVKDVFVKYGGISGENIVNTKVRGRIKTLVGEVVSQYSVLDVHMEKKAEVNRAVTEYLKENLKAYGITVESATISRTQPSAEVEQAIIQRTTTAQELEAEKQRKEKALLEQETKRIEAETKAIENEKINESLTPEMLQKMWIEKWDGHLPTVQGTDSVVIPNIGAGTQQ